MISPQAKHRQAGESFLINPPPQSCKANDDSAWCVLPFGGINDTCDRKE